MYTKTQYNLLINRLKEPRKFIQVISGPRQCGKTFLICQLIESIDISSHYALADEPSIRDKVWLEQQWEIARIKARKTGTSILILDEVQKIEGWSEVVKRLWDTDTGTGTNLIVVLLGSSPLLVKKGLTESLAGRFEVVQISHWLFPEMRDAFGWNLEQYIFFGGYPGAAPLIDDVSRWRKYIVNSLIETTVSKDILLMKRVDKPALLQRLFHLGCEYSGQILSYQKMLGQLQDAGNTTTLSHYLELLSAAWMICGLQKYASQGMRRKGSSPKLQVFNNALMSAVSEMSFEDAKNDRQFWGRVVESAVGSHLLNSLASESAEVYYWRERSSEVDFIVKIGKKMYALEVKSGRKRESFSGAALFVKSFKPDKILLVGGDGIPLEEFFSKPLLSWLKA